MHLRRSFAATAVAVVTAAPLLASCGFDYGTDRVYTPAAGTDERSGVVDVLSAVVVSSAPGEGTFIATLSNNDDLEPQTFEGVQGAQGNTVVPADSEPLEISPGGFVNLARGGGVKLTGSFTAGDTLPLSVGFADGTDIQLYVPVVTACDEFIGLDPSSSASATPTVEPGETSETAEPTGGAIDSGDDASPEVEPGTSTAPSSVPSNSPGEETSQEAEGDQPDDEQTIDSEPTAAEGSSLPSEEASAEADSAYACTTASSSASSSASPESDEE